LNALGKRPHKFISQRRVSCLPPRSPPCAAEEFAPFAQFADASFLTINDQLLAINFFAPSAINYQLLTINFFSWLFHDRKP
jgi:hypothetical protein